MTKIKNVGKQIRMVADRIMQPGESKDITPSQAALLAGDKDFEIVDETPGLDTPVSTPATRPAAATLLKVQIVDEEPVQAKVEVASETGQGTPAPTRLPKRRKPNASTTASTPPLSAKVKRGNKEKKNGI